MSVSVSVNGVSHTLPTNSETGWGSALTAFMQSVASYLTTLAARERFATVTFGYTTSASDTTSRYSAPGGPSAAAGTTEFAVRMPYACTVSDMYVYAQGAPAATCTYVARKNGSDTAITAAMASSGTTASNTANSVSYVAGDRLSVKHTMASATTAATNACISFKLTPA